MAEIIVVLIVAILVLGPDKLPSTAVQIARILKALKKQVSDAKESIEKEIKISELKQDAQKYKDELSEYNQNIRKKLSFEEFDELKEQILKEKQGVEEGLKEIEKDLQDFEKAQKAQLVKDNKNKGKDNV